MQLCTTANVWRIFKTNYLNVQIDLKIILETIENNIYNLFGILGVRMKCSRDRKHMTKDSFLITQEFTLTLNERFRRK